MTTQSSSKSLMFRWATRKDLRATIMFLIIAGLIESSVVIYAINLGVKDEVLLQWTFQFPGTSWTATVIVSLLFHLIPVAVIAILVSSWKYLTKQVSVKISSDLKITSKPSQHKKRSTLRSREVKKKLSRIRAIFVRAKGIDYLWRRTYFARAMVRSAFAVITVFAVFVLIVSFLVYPKLIYNTISDVYKNNPLMLSLVQSISGSLKGIGESLSPVHWFFSSINNALLLAAPGFGDFALGLAVVFKPLTEQDSFGKYLIFQNVAAWISAITALLYGEHIRRHQFRKRKRR